MAQGSSVFPSLRTPILYGRRHVSINQETIREVAVDYQDIPPIIVAAAIAEQSSDIERLFGSDLLEEVALGIFPERTENMSRGIAQLRPSELSALGLEGEDLFDPKIAIEGMYTKIEAANARISKLDPDGLLTLTDRYMLLALAQNSGTRVVDEFFNEGRDWEAMLGKRNNARILRYYTLHLDWFSGGEWVLPEGVDMILWRELVFSDTQG